MVRTRFKQVGARAATPRGRPLSVVVLGVIGLLGYWVGSALWRGPGLIASSGALSAEAAAANSRLVSLNTDYGDISAQADAILDHLAGDVAGPGVAEAVLNEVGNEGAAVDAEWLALPRTSFRFDLRFAAQRHRIDCRELFRNVSLNPGDAYLPKVARDKLSELVNSRAAGLARIRSLGAEIARRELEALVVAGKARGRSYQDYLNSLPQNERERTLARLAERRESDAKRRREQGFSEDAIREAASRLHLTGSTHDLLGFPAVVTFRSGDRYFGAERSELPAFSANCAVLEADLLRLAGDTIACFVQLGVLPSESGALLLQSLSGRLGEDR